MKLVECTENYWEYMRTLRNDDRVKSGFIESKHITRAMQLEYMKKHASNYRIAVVDELPAGYIGVIDEDIRICTHPDFQGKGVAKFMIKECMKIWPNAFAKVKITNTASLKLFKSVGFKERFIILTKEN